MPHLGVIMVQAVIEIHAHANKVLNIIKSNYGLNDRRKAIYFMAKQYEECISDPELKPEYINKVSKIMKQGKIKIDDVINLRVRLNL
jgi:hypothetical protein